MNHSTFALSAPRDGKPNRILSAASTGDVTQVMDLLAEGVDIDLVDSMEQSSLHHACLKSSSPTFKKGHSFFTGDKSRDGHLRVVKRLVEKGADVNVQDHHGFTPLYLSVRTGNLDIAAYLVEEGGADVNLPSKSGYTPLALAAENGNLDIVVYLVDHGADLDHVSVAGSTPLSNATKNGHFYIVRYLREKGADIHKADFVGRTPLYFASQSRNTEIINYLTKTIPLST